jgi:hypothetical protein
MAALIIGIIIVLVVAVGQQVSDLYNRPIF